MTRQSTHPRSDRSRLAYKALRPAPTRLELMRSHYNHLADSLRDLEFDLRWGLEGSDRIPSGWSEIAAEPFCPDKVKLTLRLDEDVVAFFRATGQGYLTRMNKVLRTYMLARLAGVVRGAERETPEPHLVEEYLADTASYLDLFARREKQARAGHEVGDMDIELNRMERQLRQMERDLDGALDGVLGSDLGSDLGGVLGGAPEGP